MKKILYTPITLTSLIASQNYKLEVELHNQNTSTKESITLEASERCLLKDIIPRTFVILEEREGGVFVEFTTAKQQPKFFMNLNEEAHIEIDAFSIKAKVILS